ncbi:MAG: DUF389 domain-containing protein [Saprospiraceae bacterium]|nr:DUF389 domain-containing protein [Saprospiraceae bacterium]
MEKPVNTNQPEKPKNALNQLWKSVRAWFQSLVNLEEGLDREGTIISIKNGKRMRGANAWLLICSILIASLGLDLNSPAVIIGAMLISPLMSPILGVGLAVGINDRETLFISLQHFGIAIIIALASSTLYFYLTPLGSITPEIQARTAPTLLDGLVAIFGGLAGIISSSRKDKSNALPGVAIATALMPPLCVTGFGLANGMWTIALNSFYLFFLNSFFIALTTFLIIRYLNFPMRSYLDPREGKRTRWFLVIFSLLLVFPSGRILFKVLRQRQQTTQIEEFIRVSFNAEDDYNPLTRCIDYTLIEEDSTQQLILQLVGRPIEEDSLTNYQNRLNQYSQLTEMKLNFLQNDELEMETVKALQSQMDNLGQIARKLEITNTIRSEQAEEILRLQQQNDSLQMAFVPFENIIQETKVVFPDLMKLGFGRVKQTDFSDNDNELPVFLVRWKKGKRSWEIARDEPRLNEYLKVRSGLDTLQLIRY